MSSDEDFLEDLLDIVTVAPPLIRPKMYGEILSRYNKTYGKILGTPGRSEKTLSKFVVVHHSETYLIRETWGEDSMLDGGTLPSWMYYLNRLKQILSASIDNASSRGYNFVESALHDILSRHGCQGAVGFINRAWIEKMIILDEHVWLPWWLLARCLAFRIDFSQSSKEYNQSTQNLRSSVLKSDEERLSMHDITKEMAKIDVTEGRTHEELVKYYWNVRQESEESLDEVRKATTYSSWIRCIRNLLPSYIMLNILADEARFCANTRERRDLVPLSRFVDERQADIKTSMLSPFWSPAYFNIIDAKYQKSQIRRAKFYNRGRVVFPIFVFEKLVKMVKTKDVDLSALETYIRDSLSPGHRWVIEFFEREIERIEAAYVQDEQASE